MIVAITLNTLKMRFCFCSDSSVSIEVLAQVPAVVFFFGLNEKS